ncbi:MAG: YaeQ family protein [Planctomycetes bacterium]|nr:YaeQ family protein [Planctomycetota bacterium]
MRLTVDLSINDYDRELFAERKLVFEQREGEGLVHVMLKVLALALYYEPKLQVEPTFEDEYKPDLLLRQDDYRPALWIECGAVSTRKLDKITFRYYTARFAVVKQTGREAAELAERCKGEVRRLDKIEFVGFEKDFCLRVAERLSGRNDVIVIRSGKSVQVVIGGVTESSELFRIEAGSLGK